MKHLVLGGVRSGKSAFAEAWIAEQSNQVTYIATSQIWDDGMAERIAKHRAQRPTHWHLIEEPIEVAQKLRDIASNKPDQAVIIECCSLWVTNLLCQEPPLNIDENIEQLLQAVHTFPSPLVLVSAEVGLGILPMNELARRYADEIGILNQRLAKLCDQVTLVAAGLPLTLKSAELS